MKYYSLIGADGHAGIAVEAQEGVLSDLTSVHPEIEVLEDLVLAASVSGRSIDDIAQQIVEGGAPEEYSLEEILSGESESALDMPFEPPEVWAAGVTYKTSEMERRRESETPDVYSMVYSAERPEVFFKATPERCVGPDDSVGIREDSNWNVPEPELAFVLYGGEIIGYTIGNDMSSRQIEGENPLYLPQAKVFNRCCAIGPCFVTAQSVADPHGLDVSCTITRRRRGVQRQHEHIADGAHLPGTRGLAAKAQRRAQHDHCADRHINRATAGLHPSGGRQRKHHDRGHRHAGERCYGGVVSGAFQCSQVLWKWKDSAMTDEKPRYTSEWLEKLRSMTPEQKEEYLERMLEEGRRIVGKLPRRHGEPTMTRGEIREMMGRKYPDVSLSDQIIKDRKASF